MASKLLLLSLFLLSVAFIEGRGNCNVCKQLKKIQKMLKRDEAKTTKTSLITFSRPQEYCSPGYPLACSKVPLEPDQPLWVPQCPRQPFKAALK